MLAHITKGWKPPRSSRWCEGIAESLVDAREFQGEMISADTNLVDPPPDATTPRSRRKTVRRVSSIDAELRQRPPMLLTRIVRCEVCWVAEGGGLYGF